MRYTVTFIKCDECGHTAELERWKHRDTLGYYYTDESDYVDPEYQTKTAQISDTWRRDSFEKKNKSRESDFLKRDFCCTECFLKHDPWHGYRHGKTLRLR